MSKNIFVLFGVGILCASLFAPFFASAQFGGDSVMEECCKISSTIKWTSGKLRGADCSQAQVCTILKNETLGPKSDTKCSLTNAGGVPTGEVDADSDDWAMICLISTLNGITNWIFVLMLILAVLLIVIAGAMYMSAGGDPKRTEKGKNFIYFAIIGLVIALIARFIPPVVRFFLGVK